MATTPASSSWIWSFANVPKKSTPAKATPTASSSGWNSALYSDPSYNYHTETRAYTEEEFKAAQEAAKKEQEKYWELQRTRLNEDTNTKLQEYDRLIQYANTDLTRNLEQNNLTFARAMNRAANAYGTRGLLFSGINKTTSNESAGDYVRTNDIAKEGTQRKTTEYTESKNVVSRDRDRKLFDINVDAENAAWYSASKKLANADEKEAADNRMKLYNKL